MLSTTIDNCATILGYKSVVITTSSDFAIDLQKQLTLEQNTKKKECTIVNSDKNAFKRAVSTIKDVLIVVTSDKTIDYINATRDAGLVCLFTQSDQLNQPTPLYAGLLLVVDSEKHLAYAKQVDQELNRLFMFISPRRIKRPHITFEFFDPRTTDNKNSRYVDLIGQSCQVQIDYLFLTDKSLSLHGRLIQPSSALTDAYVNGASVHVTLYSFDHAQPKEAGLDHDRLVFNRGHEIDKTMQSNGTTFYKLRNCETTIGLQIPLPSDQFATMYTGVYLPFY